MDIRLPHQFIYETESPVPVSDVIASLIGAEQLLRELTPLLEGLIPGLSVEKIEVSVQEINQGSLKEILTIALFVAYQNDLEKDVTALLSKLTGTPIDQHYNTLITVMFMLMAFYGLYFLYAQVNKAAFGKLIRAQLDDLVADLSAELSVPENKIRKLLETKYAKSRLRMVAHSALHFFAPSKHQQNVPVLIGDRRVDSDTVAEIPSDAQIESSEVPEIYRPMDNVQIELHAQDMDRTKQGWAAVVPEIGKKRLRMEIYPPIKPEDIYTKTSIRGDIMLVTQKKPDGSYEPSMFHLINLR